jgi:hypothetical protein
MMTFEELSSAAEAVEPGAAPPSAPVLEGTVELTSLPTSTAVFAREAALIGAAVGAVTEAVAARRALIDGEIGTVRYVGRVLNRASVAGSHTAARAMAAYLIRETVKAGAKRAGAATLSRLAASGPATAIAYGSVTQIANTAALAGHRISGDEYGVRSLQNVGATSGGLSGAAIGAAIGSLIPGPGTALGAIIGGIAGGMAGARGGRRVGERFFRGRIEVRVKAPAD